MNHNSNLLKFPILYWNICDSIAHSSKIFTFGIVKGTVLIDLIYFVYKYKRNVDIQFDIVVRLGSVKEAANMLY